MRPSAKARLLFLLLFLQVGTIAIGIDAIQKRRELGPSAVIDFTSKGNTTLVPASWTAVGCLAMVMFLTWSVVAIWRTPADPT